MYTLLLEHNRPRTKYWRPCGIVVSDEREPLIAVLARVRETRPALHGHGLRLKRFDRVPGIFDDSDNPATGRILILPESSIDAPVDTPAE